MSKAMRPDELIDMPNMGERIGTHSSCGGPCYRNRFGVEYCSWCGRTATLRLYPRYDERKAVRS